MQKIEYNIYIGYNDSQANKQQVSREEFLELVMNYFMKKSINFSLVEADGGYIHEDGKFVFENTLIISITDNQGLDIPSLANALSMYMNQEKVMVTKKIVDSEYR